MLIAFKKWIISKIEKRNYDVIKSVSKERMQLFLKRLYPKKTIHGLVRMGGKADGGYLIPDNLAGIKACYSPGVSDISQFEKSCLELGMEVYMADKSVNQPNLDQSIYSFKFLKKHIGCINSEDEITMDDWVRSTLKELNSDLILQMDIEGFEYAAVINMSEELLKKFRIIIIEFHSLESIWHPHFFNIIELTFYKLLRYHSCVHIHPNNSYGEVIKNGIRVPRIMEFTFLRNDSGVLDEYQSIFPHPLDRENIQGESLVLSNDWFQTKA